MHFPERRKHGSHPHDANTSINLSAIRGVVGTMLILAAGSVVLVGLAVDVPEWMGNAIIGGIGGLVGYLSREPKTGSVSMGSAETVNVSQEGDVSPDGAPKPEEAASG